MHWSDRFDLLTDLPTTRAEWKVFGWTTAALLWIVLSLWAAGRLSGAVA